MEETRRSDGDATVSMGRRCVECGSWLTSGDEAFHCVDCEETEG